MLADEWQPHPISLPDAVVRHELPGDPVRPVPPASHAAALADPEAVPLAELAGERWASGEAGMGLGRDDPPHVPRAPRLRPRHPPPDRRRHRGARPRRARAGGDHAARAAARAIAEGDVRRSIFAATRAVDAQRPSTRALLSAVQVAAEALA